MNDNGNTNLAFQTTNLAFGGDLPLRELPTSSCARLHVPPYLITYIEQKCGVLEFFKDHPSFLEDGKLCRHCLYVYHIGSHFGTFTSMPCRYVLCGTVSTQTKNSKT